MGNKRHLDILRSGREEWNEWRSNNPQEHPDLSGMNLSGMDLADYHLDQSTFYEANMSECNLNRAWLSWCVFIRTDLRNTSIINPDIPEHLFDRRLLGVNLRWSSFASTNLENAVLTDAVLEGTHFHKCNLKGADLSNSMIFGVSAWGNEIDEYTRQSNLVLTDFDEALITVDNIEIAQFLYLLINNKKVRDAIDTLATKVILILGAFSGENKTVLDEIKRHLRVMGCIPVIYDFEKPLSRNHTETVSTLAHLSKFVLADLTNQRSVPHELATIIPQLRSVPIIPFIRDHQTPYGMFEDFLSLRNVATVSQLIPGEPLEKFVESMHAKANEIIKGNLR